MLTEKSSWGGSNGSCRGSKSNKIFVFWWDKTRTRAARCRGAYVVNTSSSAPSPLATGH
jgi:hypothetical protein